jgi:hypothetical protein
MLGGGDRFTFLISPISTAREDGGTIVDTRTTAIAVVKMMDTRDVRHSKRIPIKINELQFIADFRCPRKALSSSMSVHTRRR